MKPKAFGNRPVQSTMMRIPKDLWKAAKLQAVVNDLTYSAQIAKYIEEGLERDRGKR